MGGRVPRDHRERLAWLCLCLLCLGLAVAVRWPLSVVPAAVPLDANTPLHAIAADQLVRYGSPVELGLIEPPEGVPVRMVAWPMLLLAVPLVGWLGALAAVNIATTVLLALQGLGAAGAVASLEVGWRGRVVAAVGAICAPVVLHAQSLGRPENLALPAFALIVVASGKQTTGARVGLAAAGLLVAAFSSPYQAVPAGILLVVLLVEPDRRRLAEIGVAVGVVAVPTVLYFVGAAAGDAGEQAFTTSPPERGAVALAGLGELTWPRAMAHGVPVSSLSWTERWADGEVALSSLGPSWGVRGASQLAWLGHVLLATGGAGLVLRRRDKRVRRLVIAGLLAVLFALGPDLRIWSERPLGVPLPWAALQQLPGLDALVATSRFLSGAAFGLVVGAALLADRLPRVLVGLLAVALVVDGAWRTPRVWPVPAAWTPLHQVAQELPPGPVALWPPIDTIPAQNHELATALLGRPVHMLSLSRETAPQWVRRLIAADVATFVDLYTQPQGGLMTTGGARVPSVIRDEQSRRMLHGESTCVDTVCWRVLRLDDESEALGVSP